LYAISVILKLYACSLIENCARVFYIVYTFIITTHLQKLNTDGILKVFAQLFLEARSIKKVAQTRKKIDNNNVRLEPP
jgi:hypothetical protein